jgi:hypothetical protein
VPVSVVEVSILLNYQVQDVVAAYPCRTLVECKLYSNHRWCQTHVCMDVVIAT